MDGDDLCDFGLGCIEAACTPIPIYRWHAQIEAGTTRRPGEVLDVRARAVVSTGEVLVLVSHVGQITVGSEELGGGSSTQTITMLRLGADGAFGGAMGIAGAGAHTLSIGEFDVDDGGNAWLTVSFTDSTTVLGRTLAVEEGAGVVARVSPTGAGTVQRYPGITLGPISADDTGFVACGQFAGASVVAGTPISADADGDLVVVRGGADATLTDVFVLGGTGYATCTGIATEGDRTIATGVYSGAGFRAGTTTLPLPQRVDEWTVALDSTLSLVWSATGGGTGDDVTGQIGFADRLPFAPIATLGNSTFCGESPDATESMVLAMYPTSTCSALYSMLSGEDTERTPTDGLYAASHGGSPVVAVNLVRQFSDSSLEFGGRTAWSAGESDIVLMGYASDGNAPRWIHEVEGPGGEWARSISWREDSELIVAGTFDGDVLLAPTVAATPVRAAPNGFVVIYRVR